MTIRSVILADAPVLYWPLDDPTGPAASDASGSGNPGFYSGVVNLGQPGPEVGTTCALFQNAGGVLSVGASPRRIVPFSMDCWVASQAQQTPSNLIIYNGDSGLRGLGETWGTVVQQSQYQKLLRGGVAFGGDFGLMLEGTWHHVGMTIDGANNYNAYVDGVNVVTALALPFNAIGAADKLLAGASYFSGQLAYFAHVALYPVALTAARMLAHYNAPAALRTPDTVGTLTHADVVSQGNLLTTLLGYVARNMHNTP